MKKLVSSILMLCLSVSLFSVDLAALKSASTENNVSVEKVKLADPQLAMSIPDYPVTSGDVYTLVYAAGTTPVNYAIPVDTTYKVRIANMGVINAKGFTYLELKKQVETLVSRNYPMGGVQFVLTSPAQFMVSVTGEVVSTVEKTAWSLTRLSSIIEGSMTEYSSTRDVTIVSSDGTEKHYDLFKANREGDLIQNPYLRPGDKVVVNRMDRKVAINGAVERPGLYELKAGENLKTLIEYYGHGLNIYADTSRVELTRSLTKENNAGVKIYLKASDIDGDFALINYDSVYIGSYKNITPVVFVEGAVYQHREDDSVTDPSASNKIVADFTLNENYAYFFRRNSRWFQSDSDTQNAYIVRNDQTIPININDYLYDVTKYSELTVEPFDRIVVPFKQYFITVAGAVNNPGRFPYIPDRNWEYYIAMAGGFNRDKNSNEAIQIEDMFGNKLSKNVPLTPESSITAKTNSFSYYFTKYAPIVTTCLSLVTTSISIYIMSQN